MNIEATTKILRDAMIAWAGTQSVEITFDNLPFDRPEDSSFISVVIQPGPTDQASFGELGQRTYRTGGVATARIFVPMGTGEEKAQELADSFMQEFRTKTLGSVLVTRTPSAFREGRAGKWWQMNVSLPWYSDTNG